MLALLHFPYYWGKPDGIWWFDGSDTLQKYYPDNPDLGIVGGGTLRRVRFDADNYDLPEVFARLAERPPYPDMWDTVVLEDVEPQEFLDSVRLNLH